MRVQFLYLIYSYLSDVVDVRIYICNCVPSVSIFKIVKTSSQFSANSVSLPLSLLHLQLGHSDHSLTSEELRIKRKKQSTVVDFIVYLNISVSLEKI